MPLSFKQIMQLIQCDNIESLAHWWKDGEFIWVNSYHKNQKRIYYYSDIFRFQSPNKKLELHPITKNSFTDMMQKIFKEQLMHLLDIVDNNITFERLFLSNDKLKINLLSQFYLIDKILFKINDTTFSNLLENKRIEIHLNFRKKIIKPINYASKVLLNGNTNENIFALLYKYFTELIKCYNALNYKDKIKKIFIKKFNMKVDFTKRKHSFAYSDEHIIIIEHIDLKKLLDFLENSNSSITKDIFKNLVYYKIIEDYADKYLKDNFEGNLTLGLQKLFHLLNCADNKYLIDKLKSTRTLTINKINFESKEFLELKPKYSYSLVNDYNRNGALVYNYTNNHIDNKVLHKQT